MKDTLKNGFVLFIRLALTVVLAYIILIPFSLVLRFMFHNSDSYEILYNIFLAILGLVAEFFIMFYMFRREKIDDRRSTRREVLLPFAVAIPLQFAIAFLNGFYLYTGGIFPAVFGRLLRSAMIGEYIAEHRLVSRLYYAIFYLLKTACLVGAAYLGFLAGERRIRKNAREILGNPKEGDTL